MSKFLSPSPTADAPDDPIEPDPSPYRSSIYDTTFEPTLPDNPADALLSSLADPMISVCPDCGATETLVDGLWFACPGCSPDTAVRGSKEWMK